MDDAHDPQILPDARGGSVPGPLAVEGLHHVSLPVRDLAASQRFYEGVLGLSRLERPPFDFAGAWYAIGAQALHLIVGEGTMRGGSAVDSRDVHFAIRVRDFDAAFTRLQGFGYTPNADAVQYRTKESRSGRAGFPQLFVLDPDHHVIEINAAR